MGRFEGTAFLCNPQQSVGLRNVLRSQTNRGDSGRLYARRGDGVIAQPTLDKAVGVAVLGRANG